MNRYPISIFKWHPEKELLTVTAYALSNYMEQQAWNTWCHESGPETYKHATCHIIIEGELHAVEFSVTKIN